MTVWNRPSASSRADDATIGWRSRLFGREHHERQRIGVEQQRLAAQHMEVLRGGRAVDDAHVEVGGELQEALDAGARMIRALALVAVRQQQHERRRQAPLGAARHQVLVEDGLRAVDEVAVLRLPQHQPLRLLQVVAELEAEHGQFRQRAVVDLERRPRLRQPLQRHVPVAGDRVVQHGVAVAEGAALDVLAGEADRDAVGEHRRQRQLLGGRPVDGALVGRRRASVCAARGRARASCARVKPAGSLRQRVVERDELLQRARRSARAAAAPLGGTAGTSGT